MGLRFRRTLKIAPGVRLNFNKNSMGVTLGPRGMHYTVNTSGRHTVTTGIPGSGIYYTESSGGGRKRTTPPQTSTPVDPAKDPDHHHPNLLSSASEKAFYDFAHNYLMADSGHNFAEISAKAQEIKSAYPNIANYIDFTLVGLTAQESAQAACALCEKLYQVGPGFFDNIIAIKYFEEFYVQIPIARGITYTTDYNHNYLSYSYSEILQALGQPEKALEVINKVPESDYKNIAILDLYLSLKRFDEVIDQTNDTENENDFEAIKLIFRAMAFTELNQPDLALETLKLASAKRARANAILQFANYERACTYEKMGKNALAIKELNKILVKDYDNEEAKAKLAQLQKS